LKPQCANETRAIEPSLLVFDVQLLAPSPNTRGLMRPLQKTSRRAEDERKTAHFLVPPRGRPRMFTRKPVFISLVNQASSTKYSSQTLGPPNAGKPGAGALVNAAGAAPKPTPGDAANAPKPVKVELAAAANAGAAAGAKAGAPPEAGAPTVGAKAPIFRWPPNAGVPPPIPEACPNAGVLPIPEGCPNAGVLTPIPEGCPNAGVLTPIPEGCPNAGVLTPIPEGCPNAGVLTPIPEVRPNAFVLTPGDVCPFAVVPKVVDVLRPYMDSPAFCEPHADRAPLVGVARPPEAEGALP
jgi:hypothetical protein